MARPEGVWRRVGSGLVVVVEACLDGGYSLAVEEDMAGFMIGRIDLNKIK